MTRDAAVFVRQQSRRGHELAAGDSSRGGASQWPKWKRNSLEHIPAPLTVATPARNGDEPEKSGGDLLGQNRKQRKAPQRFT